MADREKVKKGLECCKASTNDDPFRGCSECPYNDISISVQECRTVLSADALGLLKEQEAKTGHWIEKEDYALDTYYDCSVCGESWSTIEGTPWKNGMNYCPHCGAKMEDR